MDQFVNEIRAAATLVKQMGMSISIPVVVAQAILESRNGESKLAKDCFNLFGIKGEFNGRFCEFETREWSKEKGWHTVVAKFRKYRNWFDCLVDYGDIIGRLSWYKDAADAAENPLDYLRGILVKRDELGNVIEPGWATDPKYEQKIIKIMEDYNLLDGRDGYDLIRIIDGPRVLTLDALKLKAHTTSGGRPVLEVSVVPTKLLKRARYLLSLDQEE